MQLSCKDLLRLLLNAAHDVVHVIALGDGRDFQQHARFAALPLREASLEIEERVGMMEEAGPRPVRSGVVMLRDGKGRSLLPGLS